MAKKKHKKTVWMKNPELCVLLNGVHNNKVVNYSKFRREKIRIRKETVEMDKGCDEEFTTLYTLYVMNNGHKVIHTHNPYTKEQSFYYQYREDCFIF